MGDELCLSCGQSLPPSARFCPKCGHSVQALSNADDQRHRRLAAAAPAAVAEKMRKALLKGQRRPVTALFADVVGSTAILEQIDPEEWTSVLNDAFDLMSQAVYRYEGTIAHLLGDGLLAFFGTPIAHEDDPERAVRAALEIMESIRPFSVDLAGEGLDFKVRVGINTGMVIVGDVGSDLRYEYTAIGDAVNVAARIQAHASPGSILVAAPAYRFIAPKFDTRYIGPLDLKGKAEPVIAYEVLGPKEVPGTGRGLPGLTSPLIGREDHLRELKSLVEAAGAEGGGAAVLLLGEPGIGKTRLLAEVRRSRNGAAQWYEGRCVSFGRELPYHLLVDLLRSMIGTSGSTETEESLSALGARLQGMASNDPDEVRRYLAHLLALPLSEAEASAIEALPPDVRHQRLLGSLGALLRHISRPAPHVLVCEDLHWADRSSVESLKVLLPLVAELPLVVICSARDDPGAPGAELAASAQEKLGEKFHEIKLQPLSAADSRSLVSTLLEIESLPQQVRSLILEKSEGNPLFLEEVIRMLMEQGAIVRAGDKWIGVETSRPLKLPDTLQGLLLARIDRLPEQAKRVARIAAVVGRQFDRPVLSGVLQATGGDPQIEDALQVLQSFGLAESDLTQATLSFHHALIQEAVYDSILQRDRAHLHLSVARTLEQLYPQRLNEMAGVLAMHYERGGDLSRASNYLIEAGEDALRRFTPAEAYELFERASAHLSTFEQTMEVLRSRVRAGLGSVRAGNTFIPGSEQIAHLQTLLPQAEALGDKTSIAQVHLRMAEILFNMGEKPSINQLLAGSIEKAEEIVGSFDDEGLKALPRAFRGLGHFSASEFRESVRLLEQAVPVLEQHATPTDAAFYAGILALSAARLGDFGTAETWIEKEAHLAQKSDDPNAVLDADLHRGMVEGERGELEKALGFIKKATDLAEQVDNKACALVGHFVMGDQQLRLGLPEEALRSFERSTEIAAYCNVADIENMSRAWLHAVRFELGLGEEVLPRLEESLARARQLKDPLAEGEILRQRALVLARFDDPDWDAIRKDFEDAVGIFERLGARPYVARALRDYGITLHAGLRIEEGQKKLRRAIELFEEMQIPHERPKEFNPLP